MQVVSLAPVPVASIRWRLGESAWVLTVVCKLSFQLTTGKARLAKLQDPIHDEDVFPDGNLGLSPEAPADRVPARPLVDVCLVGDAYCPRGGSAQSLDVRLAVGGIDKRLRLEALSKPLTHASLGYVHAEVANNPVRRGPVPAAATHRIHPTATRPGDGVGAAGFGPLASHWPERERLLKGDRPPELNDPHQACELMPGFDLSYFNSAPADQRIAELSPKATLLLENLHPDHATLRTQLPDVAPQVFVERHQGRRREKASEIAGLWIDTRRALAAVTWQCRVPLRSFDEVGKVFVAVAGPRRRLTTRQLTKLIGALGGDTTEAFDTDEEPTTDETPDPLDTTALMPTGRRPRPKRTTTSVLDDKDRSALAERTGDPVLGAPLDDALPAWMAPAAAAEAVATPTGPGRPPAAATEPSPTRQPASATPSAPPPATATAASHATPSGPGAWVPRPPTPRSARELQAQSADDVPSHETRSHTQPAPRARGDSKIPDVVELLWFEPDATERLRRRWPRLCDELEYAPRDQRHDLAGQDPTRARMHHLHFGVLTQSEPLARADLPLELRAAVDDHGRFTPPLVALHGQLTFPFEDVEILKATAASVSPIAGDDKKVHAALTQVRELLDTPLLTGSAATVRNFTAHLRKLFSQSRSTLPVGYLDGAVERILLEQRLYQHRTLFGGEWIRALLQVRGTSDERTIPCYLPHELARKLPMMIHFEARIIAELQVRQDQYEAHAHALRVVTLGRVVDVPTSCPPTTAP